MYEDRKKNKKTYRQLAEDYGVTPERARQIVLKESRIADRKNDEVWLILCNLAANERMAERAYRAISMSYGKWAEEKFGSKEKLISLGEKDNEEIYGVGEKTKDLLLKVIEVIKEEKSVMLETGEIDHSESRRNNQFESI